MIYYNGPIKIKFFIFLFFHVYLYLDMQNENSYIRKILIEKFNPKQWVKNLFNSADYYIDDEDSNLIYFFDDNEIEFFEFDKDYNIFTINDLPHWKYFDKTFKLNDIQKELLINNLIKKQLKLEGFNSDTVIIFE